MHVLICFLVFMAGSCFGSFLHVCLSRTGWVTGRSRCDNCGYTLKWYDLIPVFSYLIYRGKCRKCKVKISSAHFVSEIMMGASFLCSFFYLKNLGFIYGMIIFTGLSFMTVAAIQDYIESRIYTLTLNGGILCTASTQLFYFYLTENYCAAIQFIAVVVIAKILFTLITPLVSDKIGAGDFDLFIIMFCLCGGYGFVRALTMASVIGCIIYLPLIAIKKELKNKQFPFAPLLLAGTLAELSLKLFV